MEVIVKSRQTLSDIAVQVYGDLRAVTLVARTNGMSVTDIPEAGSVLECPEQIYDRYLQDYVRNNKLSPATEPEEQA